MKAFWSLSLVTFFYAFSCHAFGHKRSAPASTGPIKVSFILTNDVHGHLEPTTAKNGKATGGLAYLASIINDIRSQKEYRSNQSALYVLDSGDQFQGTLLSNYDEGETIFKAFNKIRYDAAVPGNHDYDFGPIGWLYDQVTPGKTSDNPMEVIEKLAAMAKFPLLSANTYYKSSIKQQNGAAIELDASCEPKNQTLKDSLDYTYATRPEFLKPYTIIERAGVRVALIGIDNHATASMTTVQNVNSLCFRNEVEAYVELRKQLEGQADIFVLMMHNGNAVSEDDTDKTTKKIKTKLVKSVKPVNSVTDDQIDSVTAASDITRQINQQYPNGVQLVAAAHTHFIHNNNIDGVWVQQNGSNSAYFGRVDLFYDPATKKVLTDKTLSHSGMAIDPTACNQARFSGFCSQYSLPVPKQAGIQRLIDRSEKNIAPLADRLLAHAQDAIIRDRTSENSLGNILTDVLRQAAGTQIAFMNAGGIRTNLEAGDVLYTNLFEVVPFNNIAVKANAVPWSIIRAVLMKSVKTCGDFGAMEMSGLRLTYNRICSDKSGTDESAQLMHVETTAGEVLYDVAANVNAPDTRPFSLVTLDFLASGGSDFSDLMNMQVTSQIGIAREVIADAMAANPPTLTNALDGRRKQLNPPALAKP